MKKYLIINADDLGMQRAFNTAILSAHQNGVLTSASWCATGAAVEDALNRVVKNCPQLGIGIHLCLTVGKPLTVPPKMARLLRSDGNFRECLSGFLWLRTQIKPSAILRAAVTAELRAQFEKLLVYGALDHANGHHHITMIPWLWEITAQLCAEYRVPFMRLVAESLPLAAIFRRPPSPLLLAHFLHMRLLVWRANRQRRTLSAPRFNDNFCGLWHSGKMTEAVIVDFLRSGKGMVTAPRAVISEVLLHPAMVTDDELFMSAEMRATVNSPYRQAELAVLLSPTLRTTIAAENFMLTNYRELAAQL